MSTEELERAEEAADALVGVLRFFFGGTCHCFRRSLTVLSDGRYFTALLLMSSIYGTRQKKVSVLRVRYGYRYGHT